MNNILNPMGFHFITRINKDCSFKRYEILSAFEYQAEMSRIRQAAE